MEKVISKKIEESFEAGSGMLHIPILGSLFPKLFGQKMKPSYKYLIFTGKYRYVVEEKDYSNIHVGDSFDKKLSVFA
ncbi:MAG: hypothetical protein QM503_01545 [Bacteroidota bacterium]